MEGVLNICFRVQKQLVTQASDTLSTTGEAQRAAHPTAGWAEVEFATEIGRDQMFSRYLAASHSADRPTQRSYDHVPVLGDSPSLFGCLQVQTSSKQLCHSCDSPSVSCWKVPALQFESAQHSRCFGRLQVTCTHRILKSNAVYTTHAENLCGTHSCECIPYGNHEAH